MPPHTEQAASADSGAIDPRSRPRRRGQALEQAILTATVEELAEVGYHALTVDRVAARARTSKAVIYRRWPGLSELVVEACARHQLSDFEVPDTGRYRTDVIAALREMAAMVSGPYGAVIRTVFAEITRNPDFAALAETHLDVAERTMRTLLERGIERGEIDPRVRGSRRVTVATDLILKHILMSPASVTDDLIVEIVDDIQVPLVAKSGLGGDAPDGDATD